MSAQINFSIPGTLENVRLVGLAAKSISSEIFNSPTDCEFIETALVESCTNVVKHAYNYNPDESVKVDITLEEKRIIFIITDRGNSFDPAGVNEFNFDPDDLDNLPENGMGIFIVNKIMDEVNYVTSGGENKLKLVKYS